MASRRLEYEEKRKLQVLCFFVVSVRIDKQDKNDIIPVIRRQAVRAATGAWSYPVRRNMFLPDISAVRVLYSSFLCFH